MIQIGLWNYSFINETNEKMTEWVDDDVSLSICRYSTSFVHIAYVVFYFYLILSPFKLSPVSEMPSKMPTNSKMRMPCHFFISVTNKKLIPETNLNHLLLSHFLNLKGQVKHFHFSNLQTKFQRAFLFPKMCTLLIGWTLGAPQKEKAAVWGTIVILNTYIPLLKQAAQQQPPSELRVEENPQARRIGELCANPIP